MVRSSIPVESTLLSSIFLLLFLLVWIFFFLDFLGIVEMISAGSQIPYKCYEQGNELKLVHNPTFRREAGAFGSWDLIRL
jgi:hypothetical protein